MAEGKELHVYVGYKCEVCGGSRQEKLPPGEFTASGSDLRRCRRCDGRGMVEERWEPVKTLRPFLGD